MTVYEDRENSGEYEVYKGINWWFCWLYNGKWNDIMRWSTIDLDIRATYDEIIESSDPYMAAPYT